MRRWLVVSAALHAAAASALAVKRFVPPPVQQPLQVAVVERPRPIPPAPAPPPPRPALRTPRAALRRITTKLLPPPSVKAPEPTPEPVVVAGIDQDSTAEGGSFAVPTGNTLYAPPQRIAPPPEEVKPYAAERYAPAASLSELPRLLEQPDLRRFYPQEARRLEREGAVVLRLWLDASGAVARAELVVDPGDGLGEAALRAARGLRFSPARRAGGPVATSIPFTLHFVLH